MLAKALASATAAAPKTYIEDVFSTWLYTGNGSTQTITNGIDLSGKGGTVWVKSRSNVYNNWISADGNNNGLLRTNTTDAAITGANASDNWQYTSTGFNILSTAGSTINGSGSTFASWTFRKAAKFFDVVTYTGNGVFGRTVNHNLGSVPGCIIVKRTDSGGQWFVYHRGIGNRAYVLLNSPAAAITGSSVWNDVDPTSTSFQVSSTSDLNADGGTFVAYLFAHDAGGFGDSGNDNVISCGSYTGNGSASGPTINLGWEPQWLVVKRASGGTGGWEMIDNMRGFVAGGNDAILYADLSNAEAASDRVSPTGTGFQVTTSSTALNNNGDTYIYIAIRRGPMKTPTDATKVFSANTWTGTGATQQITTGFFPDACLAINRNKQATLSNWLFDNLRGANKQSYTHDTAAEVADSGKAFTMTGLSNNSEDLNSTVGSATYVGEFFRRAPGFFDVVAYTGTGVVRTVSHNLGVVPELMIVKRRDAVESWFVYSSALGNTKYLTLNGTAASATGTDFWNSTNPTSTQFTVGLDLTASNYIAYLFASCPGVSKVGSYTGTGTTQQINCGFTAGARFVLIKRTDSTGSWYIWDSARGIISGNDPYLLLNSTAAEVTNTDYIDPYSPGFEISSTAPAEINANGGSYIFLAVA